MTDKQRKLFYFPAWSRCADALDWRMERARLLADLAMQRRRFEGWPEPARSAGLSVLDYAEQIAAEERRRVVAEDLRHGCNLVATAGQTDSSNALSNRQVNRVVILFRLLRDGDDLDAVVEWLHPDQLDRRSLVSFIKKQAPEAVLITIAGNAFATIYWEDLDTPKLKWMLKQVKGRRGCKGQGETTDCADNTDKDRSGASVKSVKSVVNKESEGVECPF